MDCAMLHRAGAAFAAGALVWTSSALAEPFALIAPQRSLPVIAYAPEPPRAFLFADPDAADDGAVARDGAVAPGGDLPAHLRRQVVRYPSREAPGTIVIDTPNAYLYYVLGNGLAIRYGIGVGREGFTWSGVQSISRKAEWPDWVPPADMIRRQPYLPRWVAGGPHNPLGARALYLGDTMFRIHGTNAPSTIGQRVSSGCIRMTNEDVIDLYERVEIGSRVVVLPAAPRAAPPALAQQEPAPRAADRPPLPLGPADRVH